MIGRFFYTFENCVSMGTFYCVHFLGSYRVFFLPGFQSDLVASHSQTEEMPRPFGFYLVFFFTGLPSFTTWLSSGGTFVSLIGCFLIVFFSMEDFLFDRV